MPIIESENNNMKCGRNIRVTPNSDLTFLTIIKHIEKDIK